MIKPRNLKAGTVVLYQVPKSQIIKARVETNNKKKEIIHFIDVVDGSTFFVNYKAATKNVKKIL